MLAALRVLRQGQGQVTECAAYAAVAVLKRVNGLYPQVRDNRAATKPSRAAADWRTDCGCSTSPSICVVASALKARPSMFRSARSTSCN